MILPGIIDYILRIIEKTCASWGGLKREAQNVLARALAAPSCGMFLAFSLQPSQFSTDGIPFGDKRIVVQVPDYFTPAYLKESQNAGFADGLHHHPLGSTILSML